MTDTTTETALDAGTGAAPDAAATTAAAGGPAQTVLATPTAADADRSLATDDDVVEAMTDVVDPELGINVVDLGLLYGQQVHADNTVTLDMTLTSAACPLTDVIEDQTRSALAPIVDDVRINWVWMPPWGPDKITDDGRDQLRALGFNV
jgi:metal-sulfur cluster biosynthetic enzyme